LFFIKSSAIKSLCFTCRTASGELITVQNFPDLRIGKSEKQTNDLAAFVQVGKKYDLVVYEPRVYLTAKIS
jgi:hypothetical protein